MNQYSDNNIIPIGDHCAISLILKDLNLRKCSYPFDWVSKLDQLYNMNFPNLQEFDYYTFSHFKRPF